MQNTMDNPSNLWQKLTIPNVAITDPIRRQRAKLLNQILLVVIPTLLIVTVLTIMRDLSLQRSLLTAPITIPLIVAFSVNYWINRQQHHQLSIYLFIAAAYIAVIALTALGNQINNLFYLLPALLVAAMFLEEQQIRVLGLLTIGAVIVFHILYSTMGGPLRPISSTPIMHYILVSIPVVLTYMSFRHAIEKERRAELERVNARLRESEAKLEQRVKERTVEVEAARQETEVALKQALEADRLKSQFLASMSHELRTPLNSILTFNELMMMGTFGDVNEEQVDYLSKSLNSGRHLLSLINDVLDITKIQSGMMKLFIEDNFDMNHEVKTVAETAKTLLGEKSVDLVVNIEDEFPLITCDKRRIRQVMLNLMSNAVKFTEDGAITVSAALKDDHLLFSVADTGPGISADQLTVIFEPFIQTETGIKHAGGTGLGLPISKRLVEAHGGRLWADSTLGEGATFYALLPLEPQLTLGETEI